MRRKVCSMGILVLTIVLVCCFAGSALAVSVNCSGSMGNYRYDVLATGSLTATAVNASTYVVDTETDEYLFYGAYRYTKIVYEYYPDGGGGLEQGIVSREVENGVNSTVSASTDTNSDIYSIRYATFYFRAAISDENGDFEYSANSTKKEYVP